MGSKNSKSNRYLSFNVFVLAPLTLVSFIANAQKAAKPIRERLELLKPPNDVLDYESAIFREVGVVQRKAMDKSNRFLISTGMAMDFSDGPYTNYFYQINPGFAIGDFWEVYLTYAPFFITKPRSIVKKVESLKLIGGQSARISVDGVKTMYGAEVLWAPLYGKDSLGNRYLVRSDTFFRAGYSRLTYQSKLTGNRFYGAYGKTYFINRSLGFRASLVGNMMQTVVDAKQTYIFQAALELGLSAYF